MNELMVVPTNAEFEFEMNSHQIGLRLREVELGLSEYLRGLNDFSRSLVSEAERKAFITKELTQLTLGCYNLAMMPSSGLPSDDTGKNAADRVWTAIRKAKSRDKTLLKVGNDRVKRGRNGQSLLEWAPDEASRKQTTASEEAVQVQVPATTLVFNAFMALKTHEKDQLLATIASSLELLSISESNTLKQTMAAISAANDLLNSRLIETSELLTLANDDNTELRTINECLHAALDDKAKELRQVRYELANSQAELAKHLPVEPVTTTTTKKVATKKVATKKVATK